MRKKFTTEEKLNAVHAYLDGTTSQKKLAKNLGTSQAVVQRWLANYQSMGEAAFYKKGNSSYSARLKFSLSKITCPAKVLCGKSVKSIESSQKPNFNDGF